MHMFPHDKDNPCVIVYHSPLEYAYSRVPPQASPSPRRMNTNLMVSWLGVLVISRGGQSPGNSYLGDAGNAGRGLSSIPASGRRGRGGGTRKTGATVLSPFEKARA